MTESQQQKQNEKHICDYGCGREAHYQMGNGKWCCSEHYQSCPAIRKKNSQAHQQKNHKCPHCGKKLRPNNYERHVITCAQNPNADPSTRKTYPCQFCGQLFDKSNKCRHEPQCPHNPKNKCYCKQCGKLITRHVTSRDRGKFCSQSCAAKFNNRHRTSGYTRSQLEEWIEEQLEVDFPELDIRFNEKELLDGLELDIYFPELRFAVEINGIFHYEPIYSKENFKRRVELDKQKQQLCNKKGVELLIINTSEQENFTPQSSWKYYDIIKEHVRQIGARFQDR